MYIGITFFFSYKLQIYIHKSKRKRTRERKTFVRRNIFFLHKLLFVRTCLKIFLIISWKNQFESERQVVQRKSTSIESKTVMQSSHIMKRYS